MEGRTLLALTRLHHPGSSWAVQGTGAPRSRKSHPCCEGQPQSSHHSHIHDKDVAQGQGRIETAPESGSIPKNAGSSVSCDPEANSLPRSSQRSTTALPPCSTVLPHCWKVWAVPFPALRR